MQLISVSTHSDDKQCSGYWQDCATKFCHDAVRDGRADVWLDDKNALHVFMLDHGCRDLAEVIFFLTLNACVCACKSVPKVARKSC